MATVQAPLLSFEATGSVGNALTYQRNRSTPVAKAFSKPTGDPTPAQSAVRGGFIHAERYWRVYHTMPAMHNAWKDGIPWNKRNWTAYTCCMARALPVAHVNPKARFFYTIWNNSPLLVQWWFVGLDGDAVTWEIGDWWLWAALYPKEPFKQAHFTQFRNSVSISMSVPGHWQYRMTCNGEDRAGLINLIVT